MVRKPWITSYPKSSGMWWGDSVTAMRCSSLMRTGSVKKRNDPSLPCRVKSSACCLGVYCPGACSNWPIFSSTDIFASKSSANFAVFASASCVCCIDWTCCAISTDDTDTNTAIHKAFKRGLISLA
jgi:hypothetical protein